MFIVVKNNNTKLTIFKSSPSFFEKEKKEKVRKTNSSYE